MMVLCVCVCVLFVCLYVLTLSCDSQEWTLWVTTSCWSVKSLGMSVCTRGPYRVNTEGAGWWSSRAWSFLACLDSSHITNQVVLGYKKKQTELAMGNKPVSSTPLWPLLQFLPPGSCLEVCLLGCLFIKGSDWKLINPFLHKLLLSSDFITAIEGKLKQRTKQYVAVMWKCSTVRIASMNHRT